MTAGSLLKKMYIDNWSHSNFMLGALGMQDPLISPLNSPTSEKMNIYGAFPFFHVVCDPLSHPVHNLFTP